LRADLGAQVLRRRNLIIATDDSDGIFITLDGLAFQCPEHDIKPEDVKKQDRFRRSLATDFFNSWDVFNNDRNSALVERKDDLLVLFMSTTIYFEPHPPFFIGGLRPI
jgi:alpha-acetolactate decarboxylase